MLDVRGLTSYADYFVVMTADSDRQASAIADHVEHTMKEQGVTKVGVEGYETGRWILVDYGDVVAHVMNRDSRGFYDLEGLWADAPKFHRWRGTSTPRRTRDRERLAHRSEHRVAAVTGGSHVGIPPLQRGVSVVHHRLPREVATDVGARACGGVVRGVL